MAEEIQEKETKLKEAYALGGFVLLILAVFTVGEFILATIATSWGGVLLFIAIAKAFFVIRDYMHLPRLFSEEEDH